MKKTEEFVLLEDLLNYTQNHVFLTGKAGTGKTTFLQYFYNQTHKNCVIAAPTGVAAINAGGVTLHSLFNLPFQAYIPTLMSVDTNLALNTNELRKHFKYNSSKRKLLQELDILIIDEISMVSASMLDAINQALQFARRKNVPFGGVQVLMIGDMFQLPPVMKRNDWNVLSKFYKSPYFFDSKVLENATIVSVELKEVFRQSDSTFIDLLNSVRNNTLNKEEHKLLNNRHLPKFENKEKIITLSTHNSIANSINQKNLNDLKGKSYTYSAEIEGKFPENAYPIQLDIQLKKGAKVMFIKNDSSPDKRYYNGKIVEIKSIDEDEIWVEFEDSDELFLLEKEIWYNKRFSLNEENDIEEETLGSFTHYPIRLAWAITIHKSQGLTFEKVVIDAGKSFAPGQVYVALSRCKSLEGIYLHSEINASNLFSDKAIIDFQDSIWNLKEVNDILEKEKKPTALLSLTDTLSLEKPLWALQNWVVFLHKKKLTHAQKISTVQIKIEKELKKLDPIAKKFKSIIFQTYNQAPQSDENWDEIIDRSKKAIQYFHDEYLHKILLPLDVHVVEFEKKSKVSTYLKELYKVENDLLNYFERLKKAQLLEVKLFEGSSPKRKTKEEKVKEKKAKGETYRITLKMFNEGKNMKQISEEREMSLNTIQGHIIKLIGEDKITDFAHLISNEQLQTILKVLPKKHETMGLKEIMEATDNKFSYFELRLVKALKE